ncbi:MAG: hypothetical protein U9R15_08375 [Chloroflexota bacterium]|nr:hypothetical protein [Chloroflexota bacterium]
MANVRIASVARFLSAAIVVVLLVLIPCSAPFPPWRIYAFHDGDLALLPVLFSPLPPVALSPCPLVPLSPCPLTVPADWRVTASTLADATNDGAPEWVLLVWRPWRDWPIQRWSTAPSPIAGFHDAAGDSCHLILLDPSDGREIWAGSALPAPLLALAVGDVDGDGRNEVVTLEGDYAAGRDGPATRVDVWRWNGFGFTLEFRSPPGDFRQLRLTDTNNGVILTVVAR